MFVNAVMGSGRGLKGFAKCKGEARLWPARG